jgi:hypothetical protein
MLTVTTVTSAGGDCTRHASVLRPVLVNAAGNVSTSAVPVTCFQGLPLARNPSFTLLAQGRCHGSCHG